MPEAGVAPADNRGRRPAIKALRDISLRALPGLAAASAVLSGLFPQAKPLDWLFKIALSGTVGIWTNYFAIRMLFRPRRRTLFGIQGLIPANRKKLASAVGQAVAEDLLAPDQIFTFVEKNNLLERLGAEALKLAHQELDRPASRRWLKERAGRLLQKATTENIEGFLTAAMEKTREVAGDRLSFQRLWPALRGEIEKQLSGGPVHEALGRIALQMAEDYSPAAAKWVNDRIDESIEAEDLSDVDGGFLGIRKVFYKGRKMFRKAGKALFGISEEKILEEITTHVESPDFGPGVLRTIESLAPEASRLMENPRLRRAASAYFERQKQAVSGWLETEGLVRGKAMVLEVMDSERFWDAIEKQVDRGIPAFVGWAASQFETQAFREQATPLLRRLAAQIPVAAIVEDRVDDLDLDQLERLIYKVTSENLAGIEFLGGVLGCIAGLVLIDSLFALPIVLVMALIWVLERRRPGERRAGNG